MVMPVNSFLNSECAFKIILFQRQTVVAHRTARTHTLSDTALSSVSCQVWCTRMHTHIDEKMGCEGLRTDQPNMKPSTKVQASSSTCSSCCCCCSCAMALSSAVKPCHQPAVIDFAVGSAKSAPISSAGPGSSSEAKASGAGSSSPYSRLTISFEGDQNVASSVQSGAVLCFCGVRF